MRLKYLILYVFNAILIPIGIVVLFEFDIFYANVYSVLWSIILCQVCLLTFTLIVFTYDEPQSNKLPKNNPVNIYGPINLEYIEEELILKSKATSN